MKSIIIALALCMMLAGCGGGDEPSEDELYQERALMEMSEVCRNRGGIAEFEIHKSYYPTGLRKGEVFARGWSVRCGPDTEGRYFHSSRLPPVI